MGKKAGIGEATTLSRENVEEIIQIMETVNLKLCVIGGCCRGMECTEADGIEIIARDIGYTLGEAKDILEAAKEVVAA